MYSLFNSFVLIELINGIEDKHKMNRLYIVVATKAASYRVFWSKIIIEDNSLAPLCLCWNANIINIIVRFNYVHGVIIWLSKKSKFTFYFILSRSFEIFLLNCIIKILLINIAHVLKYFIAALNIFDYPDILLVFNISFNIDKKN